MPLTMKKISGISASKGMVIGTAVFLDECTQAHVAKYSVTQPEEIAAQKKRFSAAIDYAAKLLHTLITDSCKVDTPEYGIILTHHAMVTDKEFCLTVERQIELQQMNAEFVLHQEIEKTVAVLKASGNEHISARSHDIREAFESVFDFLQQSAHPQNRFSAVPDGAVVVSKKLKAGETPELKRKHIAGIITQEGGTTDHTAIIAAAAGIPMLVGAAGCTTADTNGSLVIIDAVEGVAIFSPCKKTLRAYKEKITEYYGDAATDVAATSVAARQLHAPHELLKTQDGTAVRLLVNAAFIDDTEDTYTQAQQGIGLFRSEFLFFEHDRVPSEEEQFQAYAHILKNMQNKPVTIRTFDMGADKMTEEQRVLDETNPLLGWRGVRYCLEKKDWFRTQLRALARASVFGNLRILIPMVSTLNEFFAVRELFEQALQECNEKKQPYKKNIPLGIMIEVPSAALSADLFFPYVDFMSIGTNDLVQYTLAADRENTKTAALVNYFEPAILRLIQHTIDSCTAGSGVPLSLCGEMASNASAVLLLLGMGLREFSMPINRIPEISRLIRSISIEQARAAAEKIKNKSDAEKIHLLLLEDISDV